MSALLDRLKDGDFPTVTTPELDDDFPADLASEIQPDPTPGNARTAKPQKAPAPRKPVTAAVKRRVTDELDAYIKMAALAWSVRDEHCAPVLNDQSKKIADALADLISRNPALVQWVETSGMVGDWLKLWMAISPVVSAFRDHHVLKKVGGEETEGGVNGLDPALYAPYRSPNA